MGIYSRCNNLEISKKQKLSKQSFVWRREKTSITVCNSGRNMVSSKASNKGLKNPKEAISSAHNCFKKDNIKSQNSGSKQNSQKQTASAE